MRIRATLLRVLPVVAAALLWTPAHATASPRPTDTGQNAFGQANYSVAEEVPYCTAHACVHWVATTHDAPADLSDGNSDGTPDSVEQAGQALEAVYARETGPPPSGLAWRAPLGDGTLGGDARITTSGDSSIPGLVAQRGTGCTTRYVASDRLRRSFASTQ